MVLWRGEAAGALAGGGPFAPRVRLFGELGPQPARERAARRLEAFVAAEAGRRLPSLRRLKAAVAEGAIEGPGRAASPIAWSRPAGCSTGGRSRPRSQALSQAERRALRALGVRIGAFASSCRRSLAPERCAFAGAFARLAAPDWRRAEAGSSAMPSPPPPADARWRAWACARSAAWPRRSSRWSAWTSACAPRRATRGGAVL